MPVSRTPLLERRRMLPALGGVLLTGTLAFARVAAQAGEPSTPLRAVVISDLNVS